MNQMADGLGFIIRLFVMLFCWLIITLYVSPEFAALMGLALLGLWLAIVLPMAILKYLARPKPPFLSPLPLAETNLSLMAPAAFGEAYVPGQSLATTDSGPDHQLPDIPRDLLQWDDQLPPHPDDEPPFERPFFRRTLILPVAAILMLLGAWQSQWLYDQLTDFGLHRPEAIAWNKLTAPATRIGEIRAAARLALRREGGCRRITDGRSSPVEQFSRQPDAPYLYEFHCKADNNPTGETILVWVKPDELTPLPWPALITMGRTAPMEKDIAASCQQGLRKALQPLKWAISANHAPAVRIYHASLPYRAYARAILTQHIVMPNGQTTDIGASCWLPPRGAAVVRLDAVQ